MKLKRMAVHNKYTAIAVAIWVYFQQFKNDGGSILSHDLITRAEFADLMNVNIRTVDRLTKTKEGFPRRVDFLGGNAVRFKARDVRKWLARADV